MLVVWLTCAAAYLLLPFQLINRTTSLYGFVILAVFILSFVLGTRLVPAGTVRTGPWRAGADFSLTDKVLQGASIMAIACFLLDLQDRTVLDLAESYARRSDQAAALLAGDQSASSIYFQIGFLLYPAGYVYVARRIIYETRPRLLRLLVFGFLPVLLATVSMGGRSPLLYGILIAFVASMARKSLQPPVQKKHATRGMRARNLGFVLLSIGAFYYFIAVFFARAEVVGGVAAMFDVAENIWGIGFRGPGADLWFEVLGDEVMYLIFIFSWYSVQGLLMSNFLFTDYDGVLQFGVYGVDLISALARRINGPFVASSFDSLLQLGTYGFLPSAFGSLYVDLWFFGLFVCAAWGALAALVFRKVRARRDARWLLLVPFINVGIVCSLINTPLGFSNGFVTHGWLLLGFWLAKRQTATAPSSLLPIPATPGPS